jgi:cob(I)alamin adenosyltransferase
MNPTVVKNELLEARKRLDEAYEHIKKAMAYADDEINDELEEIRKRLVLLMIDIDAEIELIEVESHDYGL